jgi:putative colanic acid biosynthesis acetyltransferase WcaF
MQSSLWIVFLLSMFFSNLPKGLLYYSTSDYARRALWALVQPLWRFSPRPFWCFRRLMLSSFGADVASDLRIYSAARVYQPWNLKIGPRCTLSWDVTLYCLGSISIGADVVISQGSHLCAGDHDFHNSSFALIKPHIVVKNGVWIAAEVFVGPGTVISERAVLGARAVVFGDVPAGAIVVGNPSRVIGQR